jgi:hypothetical protein
MLLHPPNQILPPWHLQYHHLQPKYRPSHQGLLTQLHPSNYHHYCSHLILISSQQLIEALGLQEWMNVIKMRVGLTGFQAML